MRNVIPQFDSLGERRVMIQRLVLIGLLLIPATAAALLLATKSAPASVQSQDTTMAVPDKKASSAAPIETPVSSTTTSDQTSVGSSVNISTTQSPSSAPSKVDLRVNNQPVAVPDDANVHKVIQQGNTTTVLDVTNSSTNTEGMSQSSTNINVNSSSEAVQGSEGP